MNRPGRRPLAYLLCLTCRRHFYSALPEAIEAAQPLAADRVLLPVPEPGITVHAPTLFGATPARAQAFVKVGAGVKGRSSGDVIAAIRRGKDAAVNDE